MIAAEVIEELDESNPTGEPKYRVEIKFGDNSEREDNLERGDEFDREDSCEGEDEFEVAVFYIFKLFVSIYHGRNQIRSHVH